jgi:hypothetical protein
MRPCWCPEVQLLTGELKRADSVASAAAPSPRKLDIVDPHFQARDASHHDLDVAEKSWARALSDTCDMLAKTFATRSRDVGANGEIALVKLREPTLSTAWVHWVSSPATARPVLLDEEGGVIFSIAALNPTLHVPTRRGVIVQPACEAHMRKVKRGYREKVPQIYIDLCTAINAAHQRSSAASTASSFDVGIAADGEECLCILCTAPVSQVGGGATGLHGYPCALCGFVWHPQCAQSMLSILQSRPRSKVPSKVTALPLEHLRPLLLENDAEESTTS